MAGNSCKIGIYLNEQCHKTSYTRKQGFVAISSITEDDKITIKRRTGLRFDDTDQICYHHEVIYLSGYQKKTSKYCADPWSLHQKRITKCLVDIDEEAVQLLSLKPGQRLCVNCNKRYTEENEFSDQTVDCEFGTPGKISTESLNKSAEILQCTPVKTTGLHRRDRVVYGKRKVKQIHNAVKVKCAKAFDLRIDEFDSSSSQTEDDSDIQRLMTLLKEKVRNASRQMKIKLLTLVPDSWTIRRTIEEFGVTEHMVKRARKLKKEKGLLGDPDPKKGRPLSPEICERVAKFYQSDDYSRMCPGIKECVGNNQKKLLLVNLNELYAEYKKKYPRDKIGFSKFCELRPKFIVPVTASGMHNVCVCQIHQNTKLLTAAIPGSRNVDYKDIMGKMVCSLDNRECMLHLCEECPGKVAIRKYLSDLFTAQDYEPDDRIEYKQWLHTDRTTLMTISTTVEEFIPIVVDSFDNLRQHHFIAKAQSNYISKLKDNLGPNEAVVLLDFAENYSFVVQDAVQAYHWNNSQATLHPFVVYYKSDGELKSLSICVISDYLKHDTVTVHSFISVVLSHVRAVLPFINKIIYFSDGAAGQYKNYKNFTNLCYHKQDHKLEAEWHFFATSHGKSPCDGIGGTVKRLVARASLQATTQSQILTAPDMFKWASENIPGIKFFYVSAENVLENSVRYDLSSRFATAKTLSGTRSHHCFIPISKTELKMKRISADTDFTVIETQLVVATDDIVPEELLPGKYIACVYDKNWFIGCIQIHSDENHDVYIDFMKEASTAGLFSWPTDKQDTCWVPYQDIICLIDAPEIQGRSARFYKLSIKDDAHIHAKLSSFI